MAIDDLDTAYIAIGAKQALVELKDDPGSRFEGELGYIQACIDHASLLDRVWQECEGTFPGVWCYEVAESFGYVYGRHIQQGGCLGEAERILRNIVLDAMRRVG